MLNLGIQSIEESKDGHTSICTKNPEEAKVTSKTKKSKINDIVKMLKPRLDYKNMRQNLDKVFYHFKHLLTCI